MRIQVITFNLKDMTDGEMQKVMTDVFVPALQKVPGLIAKVLLHDAATGTYGGVYTWRDSQAMDDYPKSELFRGFASDPHIVNVTTRTLDVMDNAALIIGVDGSLQ